MKRFGSFCFGVALIAGAVCAWHFLKVHPVVAVIAGLIGLGFVTFGVEKED